MTTYFKYPRTLHIPYSGSITSDDKIHSDINHFMGKNVVITEKLDGENTTLYPDGHTHARSIDSKYHASRSWIKADWANKAYRLGPDLRIVGENLYAKHSIGYNHLTSYFYGFSVFHNDICLSWNESKDLIHDFGYPTPNAFFEGILTPGILDSVEQFVLTISDCTEGFVLRIADEFHIDDFSMNVAKYVRPNHVQTDNHWMHGEFKVNKLNGQD